MRTTILRVILTVFVAFCSVGILQAQEVAKTETPALTTETAEQKFVRLRAAQLKLEGEVKEAREALRKTDTPEQAKARKEFDKQTKSNVKAEHSIAVAFAEANITGCSSEDELKAVKVNPAAVGNGAYEAHIFITVMNPQTFPISLQDGGVTVVGNLCPGGSVTLFRKLSGWETDYERRTFHYTAIGRFSDGAPGIADSPFYTLSVQDKYNGQREQRPGTWIVQLRRVRTEK